MQNSLPSGSCIVYVTGPGSLTRCVVSCRRDREHRTAVPDQPFLRRYLPGVNERVDEIRDSWLFSTL
jgi:hypothetical protein